MSKQIEEAGVEQKEKGTEGGPGQEMNPEEADKSIRASVKRR